MSLNIKEGRRLRVPTLYVQRNDRDDLLKGMGKVAHASRNHRTDTSPEDNLEGRIYKKEIRSPCILLSKKIVISRRIATIL